MNLRQKIKKNSIHALSTHWIKVICNSLIIIGIWIFFILLESISREFLGIHDYINTSNTQDSILTNVPNTSAISLLATTIFLFLFIIIFDPILTGLKRFSYSIACSDNTSVGQLFHYFRSTKLFFKSIYLNISILTRTVLWTILFCIPSISIIYFSYISYNNLYIESYIYIFLLLTGLITGVISILFGIAVSGKYFLAYYLFIDNPDIPVKEHLHKSILYTKSRLGDILIFRLSFIPSFLFSFLIVPLFFAIPYISTSEAIYAKYIIEYNKYYNSKISI